MLPKKGVDYLKMKNIVLVIILEKPYIGFPFVLAKTLLNLVDSSAMFILSPHQFL